MCFKSKQPAPPIHPANHTPEEIDEKVELEREHDGTKTNLKTGEQTKSDAIQM